MRYGFWSHTGKNYTIEQSLPFCAGLSAVRSSVCELDPNPSAAETVRFAVNFSREVGGVEAGDFSLAAAGNISNAGLAEVSGSGAAYTVTVSTGAGDGFLRLDLVDDDSILDGSNNPLGGTVAGNGNYAAGESYTINRASPFVTSILRADPSPTSADSVRFTVGFSEPVIVLQRKVRR